jgi:hypothetical protein
MCPSRQAWENEPRKEVWFVSEPTSGWFTGCVRGLVLVTAPLVASLLFDDLASRKQHFAFAELSDGLRQPGTLCITGTFANGRAFAGLMPALQQTKRQS